MRKDTEVGIERDLRLGTGEGIEMIGENIIGTVKIDQTQETERIERKSIIGEEVVAVLLTVRVLHVLLLHQRVEERGEDELNKLINLLI